VARESLYGEMFVDNCFNFKWSLSLSHSHSCTVGNIQPYGHAECCVTLANEIETSQTFLSPIRTFGKLNAV
jgi:hypothetical protein